MHTVSGPQQLNTQPQPEGQSRSEWHGWTASQKKFSAQKQQPATLWKQQQQPSCPHSKLHAGQSTQPPASAHLGEFAACAEAAVTIVPAPTAAAPTPARFSRLRLVTFALAMLVTSVSAVRFFRSDL